MQKNVVGQYDQLRRISDFYKRNNEKFHYYEKLIYYIKS
jgi:hypothetical protein